MDQLQFALDRIRFARKYTLSLVDATDQAEWFRMPPAGVSHIAWQVGHIAAAQFGLCLLALRGPKPEDAAVLTDEFRSHFKRESQPAAEQAAHPSAAELRAALDRVHEYVLAEVAKFPLDQLDEPTVVKIGIAKTKGEALMGCSSHEMLHAGQIGLLRRQLGHHWVR
jgi:hypothetical protein